MAIAETISCQCNECHILICISSNDWVDVSSSYATYECRGTFTDSGLEQVQQVRVGSKDSELEGCLVKPLRCYGCKTPLGVKCVEAPAEKIANVNRSYLKLSKMTMKSITSGNLVEAKTKKRLKNDKETSSTDPLAPRPNVIRPASSQKPPATQSRDSKVEYSRPLTSDQVLDLNLGPTANPLRILEEQRGEIDRVMACVNILQQDMKSLREYVASLAESRSRASQGIPGDVDSPTNVNTPANKRLSELDGLKTEMKIMQQRIKRFEDSVSTGRWSSTGSDSAPVLSQSSSAIAEQGTPPNDARSNGFYQAARTLTSAYFDGLFAPTKTAFQRHDLVDSKKATPHTALTSIAGTKKSTIHPQVAPQMREVSIGSHQSHQEDHTYDDELVGYVSPRSSTGSSAENCRQPASKAVYSRQNLADESAQQPHSKIQRRQSVPMPLSTPEPSNENRPARGRATYHDSKRRKTTTSDANIPSTLVRAVDSLEPRPASGPGHEQGLFVRVNGEVDGGSASFQNPQTGGKKRPGEGFSAGYPLEPDSTRVLRSAKSTDRWKKKMAGAKLPG